MDDLIKISKDDRGIDTVSARSLWLMLESKQKFTDWMRLRVSDYGFEKDKDFIVIHDIMKNPSGGRPGVDYHLTIDMAKHLAMIERNEQGKRIRQWFIERENKLRDIEKNLIRIDPSKNQPELLQLAADQAKKIKEQEPYVLVAKEFLSVEDSLKGTDEIAKELGIGEITLFKILRENKFFHYVYQNGKKVNVPYQKHIDAGRVVVKNRTTDIGTDEEKKINYSRSYFTPKGEAYICHMVKGKNA